jgi:hypothetical protein
MYSLRVQSTCRLTSPGQVKSKADSAYYDAIKVAVHALSQQERVVVELPCTRGSKRILDVCIVIRTAATYSDKDNCAIHIVLAVRS